MRTRIVVCAFAAVCLAALAGCGTNTPAGGTSVLSQSQPSGSVTTAPSGTPPATATTGSTPTSTPTTTKAPAPITYPGSAQAYTADAVNAWNSHDATRLAAYTSNGGAIEFASIDQPSGPWQFHACSADGDNTACTFDDHEGDRLTVDVNPIDLHQPHGVVTVVLDKTEFPNDADDMVNEFFGAFENGNENRMAELSSSSTATKVSKLSVPSSSMLADDLTTKVGFTIVTATLDGGASIVVLLVNDSLLGHPHAIALESINL